MLLNTNRDFRIKVYGHGINKLVGKTGLEALTDAYTALRLQQKAANSTSQNPCFTKNGYNIKFYRK